MQSYNKAVLLQVQYKLVANMFSSIVNRQYFNTIIRINIIHMYVIR